MACYKLQSLVMHNELGSCGNASSSGAFCPEPPQSAIRRTKKEKQSSPSNPEVKRENYPFRLCEKGFDSWEFSNKAVLLICKSRAQGLLQYKSELIQLLIKGKIAKNKLVGN